jgi:hypothetical protein
MHGCYQKSIRVQIVIYGDAVPFAVVRRAVITKFCAAVVRYLKLALKVVDPAAEDTSLKLLLYPILPRYKDKDLSGKLKAQSRKQTKSFGLFALCF